MANTFTAPTWVKSKPHASAEKQIGDSDPSARTDVVNRVEKGLSAVLKRLINTLADGITVDLSDQSTETALAQASLILPKLAIGSFSAPAGTGNLATSGLGFKPRLMIFVSGFTNNSANADPGIGAAKSSSSRWAVAVGSSGSTHYTKAVTTLCIYNIDQSGTTDVAADFVSMDSDGFTVNFSTTATTITVGWIAIG